MSSLSFVSSSIVYYLVFKVQPISFETFSCCLESLDAVYRLGHLRCPASKLSSVSQEIFWWAQVDSNHRPHAYQACALTT